MNVPHLGNPFPTHSQQVLVPSVLGDLRMTGILASTCSPLPRTAGGLFPQHCHPFYMGPSQVKALVELNNPKWGDSSLLFSKGGICSRHTTLP